MTSGSSTSTKLKCICQRCLHAGSQAGSGLTFDDGLVPFRVLKLKIEDDGLLTQYRPYYRPTNTISKLLVTLSRVNVMQDTTSYIIKTISYRYTRYISSGRYYLDSTFPWFLKQRPNNNTHFRRSRILSRDRGSYVTRESLVSNCVLSCER